MADVTSQGVLGAVARKNVSTEAEYGNDSFSASGYYTVGRIQAWKLSVTNGTYTVSDITGRIFKTDTGARGNTTTSKSKYNNVPSSPK